MDEMLAAFEKVAAVLDGAMTRTVAQLPAGTFEVLDRSNRTGRGSSFSTPARTVEVRSIAEVFHAGASVSAWSRTESRAWRAEELPGADAVAATLLELFTTAARRAETATL